MSARGASVKVKQKLSAETEANPIARDPLADFDESYGCGAEAWACPEGQKFLRTMRGGVAPSETRLEVSAPENVPRGGAALIDHPVNCICWRCEELRSGPDGLAGYRGRSVDPLTCEHPSDHRSPISGGYWLCDHCGDYCDEPADMMKGGAVVSEQSGGNT
jgi:hypothetical protein